MHSGYKKIILRTLLITVISLIVTFLIVACMLYFVFTADLADFFYSMGYEKVASDLYYKAYKKDNDINYCYKALNLKIKIDDEEGIIETYQAYLNDKDYGSFNDFMDLNLEYADCSVLEHSVILNDKNYLENKFISALIDVDNYNDARDRAIYNFRNYKNCTFYKHGLYNLNYFIEDVSIFNKTYEGYEKSLLEEMQNYFDIAYEMWKENIDETDNLERACLIALGNRLILVGQNINTIYNANGINSDLVAENASIMLEINEKIKGLL